MHAAGAVTSYIDVAQLTLYVFWLFFAGLIFYLRREDRREGYPLESDRPGRPVHGQPNLPKPKIFRLLDGSIRMAPRREPPLTVTGAVASNRPGAPLATTGAPMLDGVGPAAFANRRDVPDSDTPDGAPKLAPMRLAHGFSIAEEDPDPRGMPVLGGDGRVGGTVVDAWVDRSEVLIRYLEIEAPGMGGVAAKRVLVPMPLARVDVGRGRVIVKSVMSTQFAAAPALRNPDQITLLEEDRVSAYFGGGNIYADPMRLGPIL